VAENLCPDGPRPEFKFKYDRLIEIISFPNFPQKIILVIQLSTGLMKKEQNISICVNIPVLAGAYSLLGYLKEILEG
jgi:hypothetical protein